jgi:outer membrane protein OmpA-like peptidoglycan-associated protein
MKFFIFYLGFQVGFIFTQAQIVLERTLETHPDSLFLPAQSVAHDVGLVQFKDYGEKMFFFDFNTFNIKFYNQDSTLFRTIAIELNLDQMYFWDTPLENVEVFGLSQYLFDLDEGIEFLVYLTYTPRSFSHTFSRKSRYYVVDDDGSILLKRGGSKVQKLPELVNAEIGTKLFIPITNSKTAVYALPGKIAGKGQPKKQDEGSIPDVFEVGDRISFNKVGFNQSSYKLREDAYPELIALQEVMISNPKMIILLEGHTDNQGNAEINMKLSEDRVNEIKKFLMSKGIKSKRIKIKGFGETNPISSNETEETRKLNRRVEMVVLKK